MVAVYVNTQKIGPNTSNVLMVGLEFEGVANRTLQPQISRFGPSAKQISRIGIGGVILNDSVFFQVKPDFVVGLEMLIYLDTNNEESFVAFYPQAHVKLLPFLQLQMGFGLVLTKTKFIPQLVHRAILSRPEEGVE